MPARLTLPGTDHWLIGRLTRFPRAPSHFCRAIRSAAALFIRAGLRIYHRFRIVGLERLPRGRSFVMVANHASHLDALCMLSALPLSRLHRAFPAAAEDYFFRTLPRTLLAAIVVNALPFRRRGQIHHSMHLCRELLNGGDNVLIVFPEGTRSTSGAIGEFRRGIGDLVAGSDIPVVPCHLDGARDALPKGALIPRPRRIRLIIGPPRVYASLPPGKHSARLICQDLHSAVLALAQGKETTHADTARAGARAA